MRPLALLGLRGSGKTSVGRALAALLGAELRDTDALLADLDGRGLAAGLVLQDLGERRFRDLEERALAAALEPGELPVVVATGGGVVERLASRERLAARAQCVWLRADTALLARRLAADPAPRPRLLPGEPDAAAELARLAARRDPWFRELAALVVDAGRGTPDELAREIADELRKRRPV